MRMDRWTLALAVTVALSGIVAAAGLVTPTTPAAAVEAAATPSTPPEEPAKPWTVAECDRLQDSEDPRALKTYGAGEPVEAKYDSDLSRMADDTTDGPYLLAYLDYCIEHLAEVAPDGRDRVQYQLARVEAALQRGTAAHDHFAAIAKTYPAAAYRLAELQIGRSSVLSAPPESKEFAEVLDLLRSADAGGDKRAADDLNRMLMLYYPLEKFEMPGLMAALMTGKTDEIPDNAASRMALTSIFGGYKEYCDKFSTFAVAPLQTAAVKNLLVPIRVEQIKQVINKAPGWLEALVEGVQDPANHNLNAALRAMNTIPATPNQVLFIVDQAANRDGAAAAEHLRCTGPRAGKVLDSLYRVVEERQNATPDPTTDSALKQFANTPDLKTL